MNNFDLIKPLLLFPEDKDWFYMLLLLRRRKDNPEMKGDNQVVDVQYISSLESYESREERIIKVCDATRSRACLFPSAMSQRSVALFHLQIVAEKISKEDYRTVHRSYASAVGKCPPALPRWVVDLDDTAETAAADRVREVTQVLATIRPGIVPELIVPTPGGVHLITPRFDLMEFHNRFPDITVHKHNPTVLYCP